MKTDNIVLLGFVSSAVEYLENQFKNDDITNIRNFNLEDIKDKVSKRIEAALSKNEVSVNTLIKTGNEVFVKFIGKQDNDVVNRFNELFSSSLDDETVATFTDGSENAEEKVDELMSFLNRSVDTVEEDEDDEEFVYEPEEESKTDDTLEFEEEIEVDDEYLNRISQAVDQAKENEEENEEDVASILEEINGIADEEDELDSILSEINNAIEDAEIIENETEDTNPVVSVSDIIENPLIEEAEKLEKETETVETQQDKGTYVSDLINDLRKQLILEEDAKKKIENERNAVYARVNQIYPYLAAGFVRAVYDLKEPIAREYPIDKEVILLHRVAFNNIDDLRQFVEIVLNHDYSVNVDENKGIVDVFKKFMNKDGRILTNIFELANQAKLLNGEYDGYRVVVDEEEGTDND